MIYNLHLYKQNKMECKYCNTELKNIKSLRKHQTTAKYCIKNRFINLSNIKGKATFRKIMDAWDEQHRGVITYIEFKEKEWEIIRSAVKNK